MLLKVVAIDQRYVLGNNKVKNFLVLLLPDGTEFRAVVEDENAIKQIMAIDMYEEDVQAEEDDWDDGVTPGIETNHHPAEDSIGSIAWESLPESVLSTKIKQAFRSLGLGPEMQPEQIRSLANNIEARFGPAEWAEVTKIEPAGPANAAPAPVPSMGAVTWSDGAPIVPGTKRPRTVPMDEMGYPIVQGASAGEVQDTDEDGVGQL